MRVTVKGQVTIPKPVRDSLGIEPNTEVEFREEQGRYYLVNKTAERKPIDFSKVTGILRGGMTTDELMRMTRGED